MHLPVQVLEGGRVIEHMIRSNDLFSQGQLRLFAGVHLLCRPTALPGHALQTHVARRFDINETIANVIPSRLQHDRRVQHDQRHTRIGPGGLQSRLE